MAVFCSRELWPSDRQRLDQRSFAHASGYAYQRGQKLSETAEDLLDKALPKWDVNRVG